MPRASSVVVRPASTEELSNASPDVSPDQLVPQIRAALTRGAEAYAEAGKLLAQAKTALKHGEWTPWLKTNFALSEVRARRYMAFAALPESKRSHATDLDKALGIRKPKAVKAPRATPPERNAPDAVFHDDPTVRRHKALAVEMLNAGFKDMARKRHPDAGGSHAAMAELSAARDWGVSFITNPPLINFGV